MQQKMLWLLRSQFRVSACIASGFARNGKKRCVRRDSASRDTSRSIVRPDTSETQKRGFVLACCLRLIVTSKSRDFNKPEAHCASAQASHMDKGCREKEDGCRRERYNEEARWSERGESQSWGLHCCRATLIMTSMCIPSFIYDEFVTRVASRENTDEVLHFVLINAWASSLFFP